MEKLNKTLRESVSDRTGTSVRLGVDIGGTFTDVAMVASDGSFHIGKVLTTPKREEVGVSDAIRQSGANLPEIDFLVHGTTLAINALVERRGAEVALVTTKGFRDVHEIGRGNRPQNYNAFYRRDPVLVPRHRRFEVTERVSASGEVKLVPSDDELSALVEQIRRAEVGAIAVAFLNSYVNPANELRVAAILKKFFSDKYVTTSSSISRQWREYERFTTAAANAYVGPVLDRYLVQIERVLAEGGFQGHFILFDSNGGALDLVSSRLYPVRLLESGPAAGVLGSRELAHELSLKKVVSFDMGGTTAKTSLIEDERYTSTNLYWVGGYDTGFPIQTSAIDIIEVGAGGGSIAWADQGGRLCVGPRSAGAYPGPASYGLGGKEPTVTDANIYCGRLSPAHFISNIKIDRRLAAQAIEGLAKDLGMDPLRLALGILTLANLVMAGAVRKQTVSRGLDPRDFVMIAYGGAGPMHACEVAAEADIGTVLITPSPGHFSALGMLQANLRFDRREVFHRRLDSVDIGDLRSVVTRISNELTGIVGESAGISGGRLRFSYGMAMRYKGQEHTLMIPMPIEVTDAAGFDADRMRKLFDDEYLLRYGQNHEGAVVLVDEIEVVAERELPTATMKPRVEPSTKEAGMVNACFSQAGGFIQTAIVHRTTLKRDDTFEGPMIIYENGSNTVLPPGATGKVLPGEQLLIDVTRIRKSGR